MVSLGPGTLMIGPAASAIDASCLVNNARVEIDKEQDDPKYKLCGTATPGKITYTYKLTGNVDTDAELPTGLFAFSQDHAGEQTEFTFVPNTAAGTSCDGTLIMDPLEFGADEYGQALDSDFELTIIGKPVFTYGGNASKSSAKPSDTFPAEPTVTASDATNAAKLGPLGYIANPTSAWTAGQKITVGTFDFNWSGTAWAAGAHA